MKTSCIMIVLGVMPAVLSAAAIPKQKTGWLHDPFVKEATVRRAASGAVEAKRYETQERPRDL